MTDPYQAFLKQHNTDKSSHTARTLLDHLVGTQRLLQSWNQRPAVCIAGLFHSVYGTESYRQTSIPPELRPDVQQLIGEEAEQLVWLFGILENKRFLAELDRTEGHCVYHRQTQEAVPISAQQHADLCQIVAANSLEQLSQIPMARQVRAAPWLARLRDTIGGEGAIALQTSLDVIAAWAAATDPPGPST